MKDGRYREILILSAIVLAIQPMSGCTLLSPEKIETKKEVLNKLPSELPYRKTRVATLLVFPPKTQPIYDTTQIAYTVAPYQIAYFSQHEWAATPSQMLQSLLIRTLENGHYFSAVLTPPYSARYAYALQSEILEITQNFTSDPAILQFSLHVQLNEGVSNRVIATKEIVVRERLEKKTVDAGIVAANDAIAKALQKVAEFLLEKTK